MSAVDVGSSPAGLEKKLLQWKKDELKEEARKRQLAVSGNKIDLVRNTVLTWSTDMNSFYDGYFKL